MKKINFNVMLNEKDQLIHLDVYHPQKGFLVFAHFIGTMLNIDKFKITDINFWIRQTDVTQCIPLEKHPDIPTPENPDCQSRLDSDGSTSQDQIYFYPEIQNIEYQDENHPENDKKVKKISFKFKPSNLRMPHEEEFSTPEIIVRRGEKMYFDLEPLEFAGRSSCKDGEEKNVNGHICNVKLYF